jgi:DNA repair protein RadA
MNPMATKKAKDSKKESKKKSEDIPDPEVAENSVEEKVEEVHAEKVEVANAVDFDISQLEGVGTVRRNRLVEAGIATPMDLMVRGPNEIAEITGLNREQANSICEKARLFLAENGILQKSFQSATDVLAYRNSQIDKNRIDTGAKSFNALLGGGVETEAITELYGAYGSGKTQVCHTLAVLAQLPKDQGGLNAEVVYFDTEDTFRPERIRDIVINRGLVPLKEKSKKSDPNEPLNESDVLKFIDRITVAKCYNASHQMLLADQVSTLLNAEKTDKKEGDPKIKLLIIDSITTHFRSDYTGRGMLAEKQQALNKYVHKLKRTAEAYKLAIVITNQVMGNPDGFGSPVKPVGGHVLGHGSTYRIYLRKGMKGKRVAKMDDSPMHAQNECVFESNEAGIVDSTD